MQMINDKTHAYYTWYPVHHNRYTLYLFMINRLGLLQICGNHNIIVVCLAGDTGISRISFIYFAIKQIL